MADEVKFSTGRVTRFFVPLLIQGFTQSLSFPLVAGVITHGKYGVNALTAFSQGQMVMFMIGALGAGLVMTGLVFAKTLAGYASFKRLNTMMLVALLSLQCIPAIPPFSGWLFEGFFHLPHELAEIARWTLLFGVVMNAGFIVRNPPMVVLLNKLQSAKANNATMLRILLTMVMAFVLTRFDLVGPGWGLFALTVGVWVETLVTWLYARPYVRELTAAAAAERVAPPYQRAAAAERVAPPYQRAAAAAERVAPPYQRAAAAERVAPPYQQAVDGLNSSVWEQFRFTLPLVVGWFMLACSPLITAAFVARSADAADMLALHYVTLGVINPVMFGVLRLQTVSIKFQPEYPGDRRLLTYSVVAGLILGVLPLVFATPWLGKLYFCAYQNLPERLLPMARVAIGVYSLICVIQAVRARIEGIAAAKKRSDAIMVGQIVYTVSLLCICAVLLPLGVNGLAIAVAGVMLSPVFVTIAVYGALHVNPAWLRFLKRPSVR